MQMRAKTTKQYDPITKQKLIWLGGRKCTYGLTLKESIKKRIWINKFADNIRHLFDEGRENESL